VQVSAFPDRYAAWADAAKALLEVVAGHADTAGLAQAGCAAMVSAEGGFVMATYNVLGSTHTAADGDLPSWPSGPQRMTDQLADLVAAGVSVAGLQEVAHDQWDVIRADPQWQVYPAERRRTQNPLIWQPSQWELVSAEQFTVPYFHGRDAAQSLVRLRQVSSGQVMIFVNVHNPADVHGPAAQWRARALRIEAELIEELKASRVPIFLTGDFNDVDPPYCRFTTSMLSAFGAGDTDPCRAPDSAGIDQIFGWGDLTFAATTVDDQTITRHLSDHPMVTTQVQATDPDPAVSASAVTDAAGKVRAVTGDISLTYTLPAHPTPTQQALAFALAQVGKRYVLGATGPDAFDCSGLTQASYRNAGITLPRLASEQIVVGTRVGLGDLAPGDLLYYQSTSSPRSGHIAMYAGDGLVVEAANPRKGVRLRSMGDSWYVKRFVAATRVG
jgi:cell wall-associated NlpC family hydrolase